MVDKENKIKLSIICLELIQKLIKELIELEEL